MDARSELEAALTRATSDGSVTHVYAIDGSAPERIRAALDQLPHVREAVFAQTALPGQANATVVLTAIDGRGDHAATPVPIGTELLKASGATAVGAATTADHASLSLDELIAVASDGLGVAQASGADRAVHSELYDLTIAMHRRTSETFAIVEASVEAEAASAPLIEEDDPFAHMAPVDENSAVPQTAPSVALDAVPDQRQSSPDQRQSSPDQRQAKAVAKLTAELESLRGERRETAELAELEHNRMKRRIEKLMAKLSETEAEAESLRRAGDAGVASRFRIVQGLDPESPDRVQRQSMLDDVFERNVSARENEDPEHDTDEGPDVGTDKSPAESSAPDGPSVDRDVGHA